MAASAILDFWNSKVATLESGGESPWSWKLFVHFYTKKWPKVKDLCENLPTCLSRAAMTSPKFWSMGGGAPPGPAIAGSATECTNRNIGRRDLGAYLNYHGSKLLSVLGNGELRV